MKEREYRVYLTNGHNLIWSAFDRESLLRDLKFHGYTAVEVVEHFEPKPEHPVQYSTFEPKHTPFIEPRKVRKLA